MDDESRAMEAASRAIQIQKSSIPKNMVKLEENEKVGTRPREFFIFRMTMKRNIVNRKIVFDNMFEMKVKRKQIKPDACVVDIATQCPINLKEKGQLNDPPEFDTVLVFLRFIGVKPDPKEMEKELDRLFDFPFTFEWMVSKNPFEYLKKNFKDHYLLHKNIAACSELNTNVYHFQWAKKYKLGGTPKKIDSEYEKKSPTEKALMDKAIELVREDIRPPFRLLRPFRILKRFGDWRDKVVDWWNQWVSNPYKPKRKQLYLYGESDSGKSSFIRALLAAYAHQLFIPENGKFAWQNWSPYVYTHIVIDEADFQKDFNESVWKLFTAGEEFQTCVKFKDSERIVIQCPIIFTANHPPPTFEGAATRLEIVQAYKGEHIKDIRDYIEIDFSIREEDLPLKPAKQNYFPYRSVEWKVPGESLIENLNTSYEQVFSPLTPNSSVNDVRGRNSSSTSPAYSRSSSVEIVPQRRPLKRSSDVLSSFSLRDLAESANNPNEFNHDEREKIKKALSSLLEVFSNHEKSSKESQGHPSNVNEEAQQEESRSQVPSQAESLVVEELFSQDAPLESNVSISVNELNDDIFEGLPDELINEIDDYTDFLSQND
ncbi:unnamed protein product [Brachionus calyciflorus]|uniref:Uncharacterized protein n=1 Tax=Brachionus calyciflorus TaxID=104777 RepID=A0A814IQA6_9BILA|nr:unnamed protein product [Brachionus calyciflorus]